MLYQTVPLSLRVQTVAATKQESGASISVSAPGRERLLQHTRPTSKMPKFCYGCVPHQGSSQPVAPQQDYNFYLSHMQLKKLPVIPHYYNYPLQRKKIFLHKLFLCSQHPSTSTPHSPAHLLASALLSSGPTSPETNPLSGEGRWLLPAHIRNMSIWQL